MSETNPTYWIGRVALLARPESEESPTGYVRGLGVDYTNIDVEQEGVESGFTASDEILMGTTIAVVDQTRSQSKSLSVMAWCALSPSTSFLTLTDAKSDSTVLRSGNMAMLLPPSGMAAEVHVYTPNATSFPTFMDPVTSVEAVVSVQDGTTPVINANVAAAAVWRESSSGAPLCWLIAAPVNKTMWHVAPGIDVVSPDDRVEAGANVVLACVKGSAICAFSAMGDGWTPLTGISFDAESGDDCRVGANVALVVCPGAAAVYGYSALGATGTDSSPWERCEVAGLGAPGTRYYAEGNLAVVSVPSTDGVYAFSAIKGTWSSHWIREPDAWDVGIGSDAVAAA